MTASKLKIRPYKVIKSYTSNFGSEYLTECIAESPYPSDKG